MTWYEDIFDQRMKLHPNYLPWILAVWSIEFLWICYQSSFFLWKDSDDQEDEDVTREWMLTQLRQFIPRICLVGLIVAVGSVILVVLAGMALTVTVVIVPLMFLFLPLMLVQYCSSPTSSGGQNQGLIQTSQNDEADRQAKREKRKRQMMQ